MKKRIALGAVIATAIAVTGMFPAFAAKPGAPTVVSELCTQAGGTVEVRSNTEDVYVSTDGTNLLIDGGGCVAASFSFTGLTSVVIKADGYGVDFMLEKSTNDDTAANYHNVAFTVQADDFIAFDGGSMGAALRNITGTVTEEAFTFGTLAGTYYAGGEVEFYGGAGADTFDASSVTTTNVYAHGGNNTDVLKGGAGDDELVGGLGNDKLYGNAGADTLTASGDGTTLVARGKSGKYTVVTVPSGADEAWGGAGDDIITGDLSDTVAPGDGQDEISGNISTLAYFDSSAGVTVNLATAPGIVKSSAGDDYYSGSVDAFVGSDFADTFAGNASANSFYGEAGADTIVGGDGSDELAGGGGTDAIKAGLGDDTVYGDTGADVINGGGGTDTLNGGGGDDVMYGSEGDDVLRGAKGSDQAWGGKGTFDVCAAEVTDSCEFKK